MSVTSKALSTQEALQAWAGAIAAFQPLLAAGLLLGSDVISLFRSKNPGATDADLNTILLALVDASDVERGEIAKERVAALAEIAAQSQG